MIVALNFINNSNDTDRDPVVILQKNVAASSNGVSVAWMVIGNCGQGDNHPFVFSSDMQVGARDSDGNHTPHLYARDGQMFQVVMTRSGNHLEAAGDASSSKQVQVLNNLPSGDIDACIYRDGKLLAMKWSLAPKQVAAFEFRPSIWIGVLSDTVPGQLLDVAATSSFTTELSLQGIESADIVMTGGGSGANAAPFAFTLENVVRRH